MKPFFRVGDIVRFTQDFHKAWDDDASHAVITEVWNSTTPTSSSVDSLPRIVATIFKNDGSTYSSVLLPWDIRLA